MTQPRKSCILCTHISAEKDAGDPGHSRTFEVALSFDEALDRLEPITRPSSTLEQRQLAVWPLVDGRRLYCSPSAIVWLEEAQDDA